MNSIWPGKHWLENDCTEFLGFLEQIRSSCDNHVVNQRLNSQHTESLRVSLWSLSAPWNDKTHKSELLSLFIRVWSRRCLYECVWLDEWGMLYKVLVMFRYSKKAPCENRPQSVADSHTWRVAQCGMGKSVAGFGTALHIWWTDF